MSTIQTPQETARSNARLFASPETPVQPKQLATITNSVEALQKEAKDGGNAFFGKKFDKLAKTQPNMTEEQKAKLRQALSQLATKIVERFQKVSTAFRAFDLRRRGAVCFSDFAYVVDQLKLKFERDLIVQIFTYMDYDRDSMLKYTDFCNLCAEQVLSA